MEPKVIKAELSKLKHQVQELATEKARLEAELRFRDEFFSGMNHELRTPLNAILGLTEALQEQVMGALNERQLRLLTGIDQSGRTMLELIGDIFDVARTDDIDLPLQLDSISADKLHDAVLRLVKPNLYKHSVRFESNVSAEMPYFLGDRRRLKHMLVTLIATATRNAERGDLIQLNIISDETARTIAFNVVHEKSESQQANASDQQNMDDISGLIAVAQTADLHGGSIQVNQEGAAQSYSVTLPWRGLPAAAETNLDSDYKDLREPMLAAGLSAESSEAVSA